MDVYKTLIAEIGNWATEISLSNYGEPLLHPEIVEMIALGKGAGLDVIMGTNLHEVQTEEFADRIVSSGLDRIYVSFDGVDQESYEDYRRGGRYDVVCKAMRLLVEAKRKAGATKPFIELQFIIMRHNEKYVNRFRQIARDLQADGIALKPMSFNNADWDDRDVLSEFRGRYPLDTDFHLYDVTEKDIRWKPDRMRSVCLAPWYTVTVLWDGTIVPCCLDPRGDIRLGRVEDGILDAWNGKGAQDLRAALRSGAGLPELCRRCCGI